MNAVMLVKRTTGFAFRRVALPVLIASVALGASAGPHGVTARLTPQPSVVVQELQAHHDLPKGTALTFGDRRRPWVMAYDAKGRLLVTPPKGETFGAIVTRGFSQMGTLAQQATSALHPTHTGIAPGQAHSGQ